MSDLDDLLDALAKVRDPHKGDSDDDDRDSNHDDYDPNEGYFPEKDQDDDDADKEDGEERDGEDEDDFNTHPDRIFRTVMLLDGLTVEAEEKADNEFKLLLEKRALRMLQPPQPLTKATQNSNKLYELRCKTAKAESELRMSRLLEAQSKKLEQVTLELREANLTDKERRERDENTRMMGFWAAGICPEASPNWRADTQATFNAKKP
jgi:hypothetical protein